MRLRVRWFAVRFFFPVVFLLVSAHPGSAQDVAAREQQLRKRVDEVYRLFVTGEWRQVEQYLTEDSKDIWFAQAKGKIDSFRIESVRIVPDGLQANVTVMVTFRIAQAAGAPVTQGQRSEWHYVDGEWLLKLKPPPPPLDIFKMSGTQSPPVPAELPLRFDQNPVQIPRPEPGSPAVVKVSFRNITQDTVGVSELGTTCACLKAEMDKLIIPPQETGTLTVTYLAPRTPPLRPPLIRAILSPSSFLLDLQVEIKSGP